MPLSDEEPDDPRTPPDVEAEQRRFADELRDFEQHLADRRAAYRRTGKPVACAGGATVRDPAGDIVDYLRRRPVQADLRSVQVAVANGGVCLAFEIADEVEAPMVFTYNHRDSASGSAFIQAFEIELRADGTARVTSGEDADDRSLTVPARVGREGTRLTVELGPESFSRGAPASSSVRAQPPLERFAFMAGAGSLAGSRRETQDHLGREPAPTSFAYPSGRLCDLSSC